MTKFRFEVIFPTGNRKEYILNIDIQDLVSDVDIFDVDSEDETFVEKLEAKIVEMLPRALRSIKYKITRELKDLGYKVTWKGDKLVVQEVEEEVDDIESDFEVCLEDAVYNALLLVVEKAIKELRG